MHTHLLLWKYARLREPRSLFRVQWLGALVAGTIQASSRENRLLKNAAVFEKNVLRFNHFFRKLAKMRYGHIFYHPVYSVNWMVSSIIYTPSCISYITGLRDRLQNMPGSAILLVVNKVILILIGPSKKPTRGWGTWPGNLAGKPGPVCTVRPLQTRTWVSWLGVFWRRSLNMFW